LDQLEVVQRDVAALLEHGLNPPPVETTAASSQPEALAAESGAPSEEAAVETKAD
jgi:hypothetical protein